MKTINSEISQILIKIDQNMLQLIYKIVQQINKEMEAKRYCVAIFLNVLQAFDKVWHELQQKSSHKLLLHIKSYLQERHSFVNQEESLSKLDLFSYMKYTLKFHRTMS